MLSPHTVSNMSAEGLAVIIHSKSLSVSDFAVQKEEEDGEERLHGGCGSERERKEM